MQISNLRSCFSPRSFAKACSDEDEARRSSEDVAVDTLNLLVSLPSGQCEVVPVPLGSTVGDLKIAAQRSFGRSFLSFAAPDGRLLDPTEPLPLALPNGDSITAVAQRASIAATGSSAFAAILAGGMVLTWGNPMRGGDSSEVQHRLRNVQKISATRAAFAALLADETVVTWGDSAAGGLDRLKMVQQISSTERAFAAILADGQVLTWGDPRTGGSAPGPFSTKLGIKTGPDEGQVKKWPSLFSGRTLRSSNSTLASEASALQKTESTKSIPTSQALTQKPCGWRLQFDALGFLDLRLSGGILAPQHWLALRVAELHARGALMPQEGEPLSFMLLCDVVCHNAKAAQLEPVVEQFELTVDVERRHKEFSCCAATARINVNIDTVLVNFFRSVRRGLEEVREGPLQPARRFQFHNGAGVKITVKWRQLRTRSSVDLEPGESSGSYPLRSAEKFADVRFWLQDIDAEEYVTIDLDHAMARAYQMREGCPIFVEPDHDLKEGTCTLNIKSALTIYNDTAMPLRISLGPPAFQRWRHQVGDLLRSGTRGLVSFSQTLPPLADEKVAEDIDDSTEVGPGVQRVKAELRGSTLDLPAYSSAEVPVSWFLFARTSKPMVRLQPLGVGFAEGRFFPQLSSLLEEVAVAEEEDYDDEDLAATGAANLGRWRSPEDQKMGDRTKFSLFLRTYMKLAGYIDAEDMPLSLDDEDVQQVQRFKMHLGNMFAIRNMLPFPVVLQLAAPEGKLNDTPAPSARSLHEVLYGSSSHHSGSILEQSDKEDPAAACFAQAENGSLVKHTQLEGISELTSSTKDGASSHGIATYALGVDQEVALPFAKRLLRLRCFSLCEELQNSEVGEGGGGEEDVEEFLKSEHTIKAEELAGTIASATCLLKLPAISANRPHYQYLSLDCPGGQSMQVTLELTRDSCVLFVPYIFENLTPLTLRLQRDASSSLAPGCRRVLPVDPLHPDSAFFSLATKEADRGAQSPGRSSPCKRASLRKQSSSGLSPSGNSRSSLQSLCYEVPGLADVGREHRYYAVDRRQQTRRDYHQEATPSHRRHATEGNPAIPLDELLASATSEGSPALRDHHRIPVLRGLVVDSLSFGTCVRTAEAPLRRTKVLCLFPRYFVKSELEHAIQLGFEGSPAEVEIRLEPGECVPVHPPQSLDRSDRLYFRHDGLTSEPFSFQGLDGVEHCRTFHVYRDRSGDSGQGRFEPAFVQVDIQKTTFPAKNHVPLAEGYFLVLRPRDFRCAEDLLFHFDNQTPYSFFATISGGSTQQRSAKLLILEGGMHVWQHLFGFQDADECLKVQVKLIRDNAALREHRPRLSRGLVSLSLGDALTSRSSSVPFALEASLRLTAAYLERAPSTAEEPADLVAAETLAGSSYCMARWHRRLRVQGEFVISCWRTQAFVPHKARVELILEDLNRQKKAADPEVFVAAVLSVEACEGEEDAEKGMERVSLAFGDKWQVCFVSGDRLRSGMFQGSPAWRQQLLEASARNEVVELQTHLELRFSTTEGGAHNFTVKPAPGWSGPAVRDETEGGKEKSSWTLSINVPVLSVSWIHRHEEVLAVRVKGIRLEVGQHATDRSFDIGMQHLQVDHFIDGGELPVVLNRRFLHINSRWLREKAVQLSAKWIADSHIIKKLSVSLVPYWLNLELGVLIRLLDLAESSLGVNEASPDEGARVPLAPPSQPSSLADAKHMEVWRLETLVVQPLRLTIMVRSPDTAAARDHTMARRIRFLPVDMPNMDLKVDQTTLTNQFGSMQQLLGTLGNQYKRKARNSALLSVTLSYMAAILKGSMNALWWLARGPYDAVDAARPNAEEQGPWFYWVEPLVQGVAEGTYRAFAELVGNSLFGIVLVLNSIRQLILGVPRPRAQSFLDGILQGFAGLVVDTFLTPARQMVLQTQVAYHDWGVLRASLVFALCLLRIGFMPYDTIRPFD
ncbi:unnamed protein product [Symbiodinium natans]|uniref:Uncharacterized protein n=1 Tax=Symbiodinium natans TaxID=878477 RepID=A0A812VDF1_9DINO|nr:unnamed protein product [Symbiodinium natans]